MERTEIKNYIDDNVRKSTDSFNQAQTEVARSLQLSIQRMHERMDHFHEDIRETVKNEMHANFNGKMDRLAKGLDEFKGEVREHIAVVQPIITQYNDRKGFINTITGSGKVFGSIAAILGGIVIIGGFFFNYLLQQLPK